MFSNKKTKLYFFLEEFGITIIIGLTLLFLSLNKLFLIYSNKLGLLSVEMFFTNTLKNTLIEKDSTLITIAAVFIGIYFTVFSLLSSLRVESTFSILTRDNFNKLVKYIRNAFIGSFLYLMFTLFAFSINNNWSLAIISLVLLLYMLLSALRFGIIIYMIFSRDVKKYYDQLDVERKNIRRKENLFRRIEGFLDEEDELKRKQYAEEFSKKLREKENKK